uniref:Uncharacterized protein n=2 Tax=Musa acuminata subsp. malaccensis TaxID=214687 RepID=A0A804J1P5_MUSAM
RSSSSSSVCPQFSRPSNTPLTSWQDGQGIPESWCQLLLSPQFLSVCCSSTAYCQRLNPQITDPHLFCPIDEINHRHSLPLLLSFPGQMQILNENGMKNSGEQDQECNDEQKKDLRSRGLCLVPVAFMMHVGSGNGADLWAPALGGGFR